MYLTINDIKSRIFTIRGHKVMFDSDLAQLYNVDTAVLNETVQKNIKYFPDRFMFELTCEELESLLYGFLCIKVATRNTKVHVFTEEGIYMLHAVLYTKRTSMVNLQIMRTFTALRCFAPTIEELEKKIHVIENSEIMGEETSKKIIEVLKQLMFVKKSRVKKRVVLE